MLFMLMVGYHMPKWTDARWERQVADEMKCFVGKVPSLSNGEFLQNFSKKLNLKGSLKREKGFDSWHYCQYTP